MAKRYFIDELASYIGSDVEINTNDAIVDGLLKQIDNGEVTVMEIVEYGSKQFRDFSLDTINFVRIL